MLNRSLAVCLLALALQSPAAATKFHLADDSESKATVGNAEGRVIEGVILKQDDKTYTIRVVGGEITLAKSAVKRTETDDLTVAKIEALEKDQAVALAAADNQRRQVQAAEASARRDATAANAAARAETPRETTVLIEVDFQNLLPGYTFRTFDPVLGRANLTGLRQVIEDYLRREVKQAAHRK